MKTRAGRRKADNQAAVLAELLGLPASEVERGLILFLAVLVEVGAALGSYFATGHIGQEPQSYGRGKQGPVIIEGNVVEFARRNQAAPAPLKQIAAPVGQRGPRRVPRLNARRGAVLISAAPVWSLSPGRSPETRAPTRNATPDDASSRR